MKIIINKKKEIKLDEKILKNEEIIKILINEINEMKEKNKKENERINELIKRMKKKREK